VDRRGLYPIVDVDSLRAHGLPLLAFAERVLEAEPAMLQLRAKSTGARETLEILRALRPRCRAQGTLLFANDRPDLALLADADGVHVGQGDLSLADVRRCAPRLLVGVSTHRIEELETALAERPAYVAFGPVFATSSKQNPDPCVGLLGLAEANRLARRAGICLVAIGGIGLGQARAVAEHADAASVISALIPTSGNLDEITARAHAFQAAFAAS
jgi:thiamine-phosphate pyrophosphorylase